MTVDFEKKYFEQNYKNYDQQNPPYKLNFYIEQIEKNRSKQGGEILDLGCAFGAFLLSLSQKWRGYGLDPSHFAIEEAKKKIPSERLAVALLPSIPFDRKFDVITAFDVIEHVADIDGSVAAIEEHLKPGGIFFFVVPVYDGITGPVIRALDDDPTHTHKESRHFWIQWARKV